MNENEKKEMFLKLMGKLKEATTAPYELPGGYKGLTARGRSAVNGLAKMVGVKITEKEADGLF